jgi:hypothetical protein
MDGRKPGERRIGTKNMEGQLQKRTPSRSDEMVDIEMSPKDFQVPRNKRGDICGGKQNSQSNYAAM